MRFTGVLAAQKNFITSQGIGTPTVQSSVISFTTINTTSVTIAWINGNGSQTLVVMKQGTPVDSILVTDGDTFTANTIFGSGTDLGSGNYVVGKTALNTLTITGLTENTPYHIRLFAMNGASGNEVYLRTTATGNPNSFSTLSTLSPDYYVRVGGSDAAAGTSIGTAWATMEKARTVVQNGDVLDVGAGTFTVNEYLVWPACSITGAGVDQTIFRLHSSKFLDIAGDMFGRILTNGQSLFQMKTTGARLTTAYTFQNFTIDGQKPAGFSGSTLCMHSAMHLYGRENFTLNNVKVSRTGANALWMVECSDVRITSCEIIDCGRGRDDLSPSTTITGWGGGAINYYNVTNIEIDNNYFQEEYGGYCTKALGGSWTLSAYNAGTLPYCTNVVHHDNYTTQSPVGPWTGPTGSFTPSISFEMFSINSNGCEWYNNDTDGNISVVMRRLSGATSATDPFANATFGTPRHKFYNNRLVPRRRSSTSSNFGIEASTHDIEIYDNYFDCYKYSIAEFGTSGSTPNPGIRRQNIKIFRNVFVNNAGGSETVGVIEEHQGWRNVQILNNTVLFNSTIPSNFILLFYWASTPSSDSGLTNVGVSDNVVMRNNLLIKPSSALGTVGYAGRATAHTVNNFTATNNNFFRCNNQAQGTISGTINSNLNTDPLIVGSGVQPFPYFELQSGSPCINTGINVGLPFVGANPDIGAHEFGSVTTRNISSLGSVSEITVNQGTVLASVPLGQVQCTLDDASIVNLDLEYVSGTYDENTPDTYSLTCRPILQTGITNTGNLTVVKSVIVRSLSALFDDDFERAGPSPGTAYTEIDPSSNFIAEIFNSDSLGLSASIDSSSHYIYWDEFDHVETELKVNATIEFGSLDQISYGVGVGLQNLTGNPNRGVFVRVNTVSIGPDSTNFGFIDIYTGDGTSHVKRITSATSLNLVLDRLYDLSLERVVSGSDAIYTAILEDTITGQTVPVQWTEVGDAIGAFWATTFPTIYSFGGFQRVHQFTVDAINVSAPTYGSRLTAWINYINSQAETLPSAANLAKLDTFLEGISSTDWNKLDWLYIPRLDNGADFARRVNFKSPGTYTASPVASPTGVNNVGWEFNGTSQAFDTGFNPQTAGGNYVQNAGDFGVYVHNDVDGGTVGSVMGCQEASMADGIYLNPRNGTNFVFARSNAATGGGANNNGTSVGLYHVRRNSSTSVPFYKNGSLLTTMTITSTGLPNQTVALGANHAISGAFQNFGNYTIGMAFMGGNIDAATLDTLWDAFIA